MKLKKKIDKRINTIALFWDGKVLKYNKGCENIYLFCRCKFERFSSNLDLDLN